MFQKDLIQLTVNYFTSAFAIFGLKAFKGEETFHKTIQEVYLIIFSDSVSTEKNAIICDK